MKTVFNTAHAPAAIGPYNQATAHGNLLFVSGQIAINPVTGDMVQPDITTETHQVMTNLSAIISAAGSSLDHVLKCTVFVLDMKHYAAVNAVYASFFEGIEAPARELVAVVGLPKDANVEISAIVAIV